MTVQSLSPTLEVYFQAMLKTMTPNKNPQGNTIFMSRKILCKWILPHSGTCVFLICLGYPAQVKIRILNADYQGRTEISN